MTYASVNTIKIIIDEIGNLKLNQKRNKYIFLVDLKVNFSSYVNYLFF